MACFLIVPVLIPFLGGFFVPKTGRARKIFVPALLTVEAAAAIVCALRCQGSFVMLTLAEGLTLSLKADGVSVFFTVIVCAAWLGVSLFASEYMEHEENQTRFFRFYIFSLGALVGICFADNLPTFYMFYELMTLLTVVLVIHSGSREASAAGIKYLGYSIFGAALGLLGIFVLYRYGGDGSFTAGGILSGDIPSGLALTIYFLMAVGFGCKAGMLPLHAWLPTAHPVAPAPASAVLSGVITKMGVLAILRVTYYVFSPSMLSGTWAQSALLTLSLATVFMGSMLACKEKLLKKRLAWSTVSQVSYALFGLFCLSEQAFVGAFLQIFFHSCAKNALFCCAGAIIMKTGYTRVDELRGIGLRMPAVMGCFTVGALSLVGIPPTGGFISKWYLAIGALDAGIGGFAIAGICVLLVSAVLTALYLLSIVYTGFFPGADFDRSGVVKTPVRPLSIAPIAVFAAALIIFGIFSGPVSGFAGSIAAELFR